MRRQSSGSRSAISAALTDHGFHTTVLAEPVLSTPSRRRSVGSSTTQRARVPRNTRSVSPVSVSGSAPWRLRVIASTLSMKGVFSSPRTRAVWMSPTVR